MEKGKIIVLNGVSSAGKTTLAKTLQERLTTPFYWISIDTFTLMSPEKNHFNAEGMPIMLKAVSGMHHTIKAYSDLGLNTVVDHFLYEDHNTLGEFVKLLHEYPVLFAHIICPLEELRRREKERGDRRLGQGEEQLTKMVPQDTYDITIDTYQNSKEVCADKIIELLNYPEKCTALKILRSQI